MFAASDDVQIDIRDSIVPEHRALLVLWPCMTGNTDMYRLPVEQFNRKGISIAQFNPRGHAFSGGQFDLELCIADFDEYLQSLHMNNIPVWLLGHSAGASAVLKYGTFYKPQYRYVLVSPVLDSILSYRYLYSTDNQIEVNTIIADLCTDKEFILSIIENEKWMDRETWEKNCYRKRFDAISGKVLMGTLMEKLFIDGFNAYRDLELHRKCTILLLPENDKWFPMTVTMEIAEKNDIKSEIISESKDHYFTGAWKYVWKRILELMNSCD